MHSQTFESLINQINPIGLKLEKVFVAGYGTLNWHTSPYSNVSPPYRRRLYTKFRLMLNGTNSMKYIMETYLQFS